MRNDQISSRLKEKGLKVTPQRMAILESVMLLRNHPTAEQVYEVVKKKNPHISLATVYKVLDAFVQAGLIVMVKTDADIRRFDAILEKHHHLYDSVSDSITDFVDPELDEMLRAHFERRGIPGFTIEDITLQIAGRSGKDSMKKK